MTCTPYATKHGVKGDEFDTVLVVLDAAGAAWNFYSFDKYLSGADETAHPALRSALATFSRALLQGSAATALSSISARSAAKPSGCAHFGVAPGAMRLAANP